ncbi:uncharacterized protein A4U43_C03F30660 [Asparagus officinalis]|uniref:Uncharacterized protein n=1 Tax=Asparagus officinalis TaxID=4686 RepID=A0A5P1FGX3_ASPOF|nr:uncharacterized protein A4U43_C03F30660 [Asparagus officinalis]
MMTRERGHGGGGCRRGLWLLAVAGIRRASVVVVAAEEEAERRLEVRGGSRAERRREGGEDDDWGGSVSCRGSAQCYGWREVGFEHCSHHLPPWASLPAASRQQRKVPRALTLNTRSHSSTEVCDSIGVFGTTTPAQLTRIYAGPPKADSAASNTDLTASGSETLAWTATAGDGGDDEGGCGGVGCVGDDEVGSERRQGEGDGAGQCLDPAS